MDGVRRRERSRGGKRRGVKLWGQGLRYEAQGKSSSNQVRSPNGGAQSSSGAASIDSGAYGEFKEVKAKASQSNAVAGIPDLKLPKFSLNIHNASAKKLVQKINERLSDLQRTFSAKTNALPIRKERFLKEKDDLLEEIRQLIEFIVADPDEFSEEQANEAKEVVEVELDELLQSYKFYEEVLAFFQECLACFGSNSDAIDPNQQVWQSNIVTQDTLFGVNISKEESTAPKLKRPLEGDQVGIFQATLEVDIQEAREVLQLAKPQENLAALGILRAENADEKKLLSMCVEFNQNKIDDVSKTEDFLMQNFSKPGVM